MKRFYIQDLTMTSIQKRDIYNLRIYTRLDTIMASISKFEEYVQVLDNRREYLQKKIYTELLLLKEGDIYNFF
ncbi:hypothetical protein BD770DRAFT_399487 [Pilaira anomala]|nr:hypothetical protein BD770DRAFT_399487 [Pilaira anomala]